MTNLLKFPNLRRIDEAASLWIVRIDRELSEQELRDLKEWLSESPKHREAFVAAARLWDRMDVLTSLSKLFPLEDFKPAPSRVRWKSLSVLAAALVFVAIALLRPGAGLLQLSTRTPVAISKPDATPALQPYATVIGQQSLVSLDDGTQVRLNTDSLVEVSYSRNSRRVHLVRGEALFEVAKDASRPFDVRVGSHVVRAVGTAFNVRVSGIASMEVTVTEGRIRLLEDNIARKPVSEDPAGATSTASPTAVAGQLVMVTGNGESRVRELDKEAMADRTAWQRGMLVFRGEPLRDVLKEFARYTNQKFIPQDDSIGDMPVGGLFRAADVEGLRIALRKNFGLQTWLVGDSVMIARENATGGGQGQ